MFKILFGNIFLNKPIQKINDHNPKPVKAATKKRTLADGSEFKFTESQK